ncbi:LTA synthase family protein [[Lactobacillus] timonensis]|uniref:LTA synthase family protein n=1 Tax=[Lactobacillus] timonensis TaxID=1970790 RepID=UPI000C856616|nr:alkaline phosphatase family protein [[Lactobacillus] timonensis]
MKQKSNAFWTLLFSFWSMVTLIVWRCSPSILFAAGTSLRAITGQWLHIIMLAGIAMLLILLGRMSTKVQHNIRHTLVFITKLWMLMLVTGVLITLLLTIRNHFQVTDLYTALFPILRNEVPIISGLFIGLVISTITQQIKQQHQRWVGYVLLLILSIPFVFGVDMFRLHGLRNPLLFTILFLIGTIDFQVSKPFRVFLISGIGCLVLTGIMPYISVLNHGSLTSADRFTSLANPLLIMAAYSLIQLADEHWAVFPDIWPTVVSGLTFVCTPAMVKELKGDLIRHAGHSTIKLLILGSAVSLILLVAAWVWSYATIKLSSALNLSSVFDRFFAEISGPETLEPWFNKKKVQISEAARKHHAVLIAVIVSYLLAFVSMLLMNTSWQITPNVGQSFNIIMLTFFQRQTMIILNAIFIFAFTMFLWALFRRYYVALIGSTFLISIWIIASRMKILARNEPIMPSELKMVSVWGSLISMAGPVVIIAVIVALIISVVLVVYLERKDHQNSLNWQSTIASLVILPVLLFSSLGWNHPNSALDTLMRGFGDDPMFYNQLSGARVNGPIIQFLNNLDVTVMAKPHGYSRATMMKVRHRYAHEARIINKQRTNKLSDQTIIFNLSESFSNPRRVPGVSLKNNPIPLIDSLKKTNTSGIMVSSGYGGGTANMEYMTLTGFALSNFSATLATPYTQLVGTLAHNPSIVGSFKHSTAIHPYLGTFYNRKTVYQKFGFNAFHYLGGKEGIKHQHKIDQSPYLSDQTAYANVMDQLSNYQHGQFIQLVTMQNHFPYDQNFYDGHRQFSAKAAKGTSIKSLEDYAVGIHHTDQAVSQFIKQIDQLQRPITLVFYGDHLPGGIYGNSLTKDGLKLHETDYFIYSNRYAREHGANRKMTVDTKYVDPNDFIALAAEQTNSRVEWYQAMLTQVLHQLPAFALDTQQNTTNQFNSKGQFIDQRGKVVTQKHWTRQQKQLWHDYQLVQYDVTAGKQYLVRDGQLK